MPGPTFQDYFDMYSGRAPGTPQETLDEVSQARREELNRLTQPSEATRIATERQNGAQMDGVSEMEQDYRNLSLAQLEAKYGTSIANEMAVSRARGLASYEGNRQIKDNRTLTQAFGDLAGGIAQGGVGAIGGIAAWGLSEAGADEAALTASNVTNAFNQAIGAAQSDAVRASRQETGILANAARRQNEYEFQQSDQTFVDKLSREAQNIWDVGGVVLSDPTATSDVVAQGAGSLLAAGPLAKGLRVIGNAVLRGAGKATIAAGGAGSVAAGRVFDIAQRSGRAASVPLAIGAMEGGGAYSETLQEGLSILADRDDLTDEQKLEMADAAAQVAGRVQGSMGIILGRLVAKFEGNPLAKVNFTKFLGNAARETAEESLQSASAATAKNYALTNEIDPNRDLLANVGEETAYGAIGGLGSAGAIGAPGLAVQKALDAATGTVNVAKDVGLAVASALADRGRRIEEAAQNAPKSVPEAWNSIREAVSKNTILNDDQKAALQNFSNDTIASLTGITAPVMEKLTGFIKNTKANAHERLAASAFFQEQAQNAEGLLDSFFEKTGIDPSNLSETALETIKTNLTKLVSSVGDAAKLARDTVVKPKDVENADNVPAIQSALTISSLAPENVDPETNNVILKHAAEGRINLSPEQISTLETARDFAEVQLAHQSKQADLGKIDKAIVSDTVREENAVNFGEIVRAVRSGRIDEAKARLEDFKMFAQLFQNKIIALNEHARLGTGNKSDAIGYDNLIGEQGQRKWIPAETGMWVNRNAPKTVAFAQSVANDAEATANLVNNLIASFPELGIEPLETVALDLAPEAPASNSRSGEFERGSPAEGVEAEVAPQPEVQTEFDYFKKPVEAPTTPEAEETAQPEGGDTSTEANANDTVDTVVEPEEETNAEPDTVTEQVEEATPEKDTQGEIAEPVSEGTSETADTGTSDRNVEPFSSLASKWFRAAFKVPDEARTRIAGSDTPGSLILNALASAETLSKFMGKKLRMAFTPKLAKAYRAYISKEGRGLVESLDKQLQAFLDQETYDGIRQHLIDGTKPISSKGNEIDLYRMVNAKALNLTEIDEDGIHYNDELLGASVLAALQWMLTTERNWSTLDLEAVADIFELEEGNPYLQAITNAMNTGMGAVEIKRSIAQKIRNYWGVNPNSKTDLALIEGIAEGMAGEIVRALEDQGLLIVTEVTVTDKEGLPVPAGKKTSKKTIYRYTPNWDRIADLAAWPSVIEEAVMLDPEINFIGKPSKKVAETQMNNPGVNNTEDGKKALAHENQTPYYFDLSMVDLFKALGADGITFLFGGGQFNPKLLNKNTKDTLEGRNSTFLNAFRTLESLFDETSGVAAEAGSTVEDTPVFFEHNFSSIGRMQQLGRNNPQASKLMREALLPTQSTLDLSDQTGDNFKWFTLALAQALGVKVHTMPVEQSRAIVMEKLEGDLKPAVEALQSWLKGNDKSLSEDTINTLANALGNDSTPLAVHALVDYARFKNAGENVSQFKTGLYIEADGVTNGPINAIAMFTPGIFSVSWLRNMAKGGLFLDDKDMNMNRHRSEEGRDKNDLYTEMAQKLSHELNSLMASLREQGKDDLAGHMDNLLRLMQLLRPKEFQFENGNWIIDRSVAKNPLTITLYGSGENGIAGNILDELMSEVYQRISDANILMHEDKSLSLAEAMFGQLATEEVTSDRIFKQFEARLNKLMGAYVIRNKKGLALRQVNQGINLKEANLTEFTFTLSQVNAMRTAVRRLFVEPMTLSINKTVGKNTISALTNLRKATQVQSIILTYAFKREIKRALEKKGDDQFLSRDELDTIAKKLSYLAPTIDTGKQIFNIAASQKMDVPLREFGRAFDDSLKTDAFVHGFENSGVSGIPTATVGMGDGYMQQYWANMVDAITGTLKIFDGTNMPLDQIEKGSQQANEAAFQSWLNNPLSFVSDRFTDFLKDAPLSDLSKDELDELGRALFEFTDANDGITSAMVKTELEKLQQDLQRQALTIEARHNVLKKVNVTVDQMASTGVTYQVTDKIDLNGLDESQIVDALNELVREEYARLVDERTLKADVTEDIAPYTTEHESGALVVEAADLSNMVETAKLPKEQKNMLRDMVRSLKDDGYKIVIGVPWRAQQYAEMEGLPFNFEENTNGLTDPQNKVMYIMAREVNSEILVHELIHAATFEQVLSYYMGQAVGSNKVEQGRAIERLEALMNQFLNLDEELSEVSPEVLQAYRDAVAAIREWQTHPDHSDAVRKAGALNEFMAWGLSNQDLIRVLQRTKASPLARIAKGILDALKKLIWGNGYAPVKVWGDMHSNLRFNTLILTETRPSVMSLLGNIQLFHQSQSGPTSNEQLAKIERVFNEKIIQYLNVELEEQTDRDARYNQAFKIAATTANTFVNNGFPMSPSELRAFHSIIAAMATQAELDPNVFTETQKLYAHVVKVIEPSVFLDDPNTTDQNELALAQHRYDMVVGNRRLVKDKQDRTSMLSSFLALSMVNEDFRKALSKIEMPSKKLGKWNTLDGVLDNVGTIVMDKLSETMAGNAKGSPNVGAAMNALSHRLIEVVMIEEENFIQKSLNLIHQTVNKSNDVVVGAMQRLSDAGVALAERGQAKVSSEAAKGLLEALKLTSAMINEDNAAAVAEGFMSQLNKSNLPRWMTELMNEFVGRTSENAPIYDMIKLVRSWVQQTRQMFREQLPRIIASKFNTEPTEEQWKHMFYGLARTDLASLVSNRSMTVAQVMDLITDDTKIAARVAALEAELDQANPSLSKLWKNKSKQLATFMVTRKAPENLLRNARAIAFLYGVRGRDKKMTESDADQVMYKIDDLVTLYALQERSAETKAALNDLVKNDRAGVEFTLSYLVGQRRSELSKESGEHSPMAQVNHYKGYVPSESKQGVSLTVAPTKDAERLRTLGYELVGNYSAPDQNTGAPKLSYYFSTVSGKSAYSQGIIQNIRQTFSGVDPRTGFTNGEMTAGQITDAQSIKIIKQMGTSKNLKSPLLPVYNSDGVIVAFERSIDPEMDALLQRNTNLAENIGMWRGRQAEEHQAGVFNSQLINKLADRWKADRAIRSDEYINVFDPKELRKDPVLRDSVNLLNGHTLRMIENKFGKDEFWVRKDMLNDVLGYRAASVGDLWTGNSRWSKTTQDNLRHILTGVLGKDAYRRAVTAEKFWQNFITDARVTIVVKSIIVPTANLLSNVFQLMSRGVNIKDIAKGLPKKTAEIDAFVKNRLRRIELEAELRASSTTPDKARVLKNEIQTILDANRRMSIWPLIEAGEFSSISDVGVSRDDILLAEGRLSEYMERLTAKLPPSMRTVGRYGILSKDTSLFKGLQRAVEYGDFLGKAILYDHLIKQGKSQKEALADITEEFVNYDRLAGRSRTYLENMGLLWFWNFKIRSTKIALNIIRNNPVQALLAMSIPMSLDLNSVGSPVTDNAAAVYMDGRAGWSLGPNMSIHAYGLNPWVNLTT